MAEFKKRTLVLSSGKQIKLYGNSIAIGKSLEIGEGAAPGIISCAGDPGDINNVGVNNPYKLSTEEVFEIADYNIRLWIDLKDNIRKHGIGSVRIFNRDGIL